MKKTFTRNIALVVVTLASGTVTTDQTVAEDQTAKTAAQMAVEQFNECADSLFRDEFEPAEIDFALTLNKKAILDLSAKWGSRDNTINILTRIRSVGSSVIKELIMTHNGESNDELPPPAAKIKEYIGKVFEECPPEKEDDVCADAVIERFTGIEQVVRGNLEYPRVTVEKYTSNEQRFRASKDVRPGIDDYYLILNGTTGSQVF